MVAKTHVILFLLHMCGCLKRYIYCDFLPLAVAIQSNCCASMAAMPRLHLIHVARIQVVSTCIPWKVVEKSWRSFREKVREPCIHQLLPVLLQSNRCIVLICRYVNTAVAIINNTVNIHQQTAVATV